MSGTPETRFEVVVRFLHLTARQVGTIDPAISEWPEGTEPPFRPVEVLRVGDKQFHSWQEAEEREVSCEPPVLGELCSRPLRLPFRFQGSRRLERLREPGGQLAGVLIREQRAIEGVIEVAGSMVEAGLLRLTFRTSNLTPLAAAQDLGRDDALQRTLVSTHVILGLERGEFVSLMDPPEPWRAAAAACRNIGAWPVLVGEEGQKDMMLSSHIILYDYPQVAPKSPGDLFDGTEIDEILSLRIMTLTDEEKAAMASVDERASALLSRTEALAREQLLGLHGTVRELREVSPGGQP